MTDWRMSCGFFGALGVGEGVDVGDEEVAVVIVLKGEAVFDRADKWPRWRRPVGVSPVRMRGFCGVMGSCVLMTQKRLNHRDTKARRTREGDAIFEGRSEFESSLTTESHRHRGRHRDGLEFKKILCGFSVSL